ncbi:hypothetical protein DFJ73DRAFT_806625 [Zopfochytrium polystomum]|nr:hypothetical protein DFJ73DRAFT_806625 [Zopfochytrium polystomum]
MDAPSLPFVPAVANLHAQPSFPSYGLVLNASAPSTPVQLRSSIGPPTLLPPALGNFSLLPAGKGNPAVYIKDMDHNLCLGTKQGYLTPLAAAAAAGADDSETEDRQLSLRGWDCKDPEADLLFALETVRAGSLCFDFVAQSDPHQCWTPIWEQKVVGLASCNSTSTRRFFCFSTQR